MKKRLYITALTVGVLAGSLDANWGVIEIDRAITEMSIRGEGARNIGPAYDRWAWRWWHWIWNPWMPPPTD